jgi:hypothetical protein
MTSSLGRILIYRIGGRLWPRPVYGIPFAVLLLLAYNAFRLLAGSRGVA